MSLAEEVLAIHGLSPEADSPIRIVRLSADETDLSPATAAHEAEFLLRHASRLRAEAIILEARAEQLRARAGRGAR